MSATLLLHPQGWSLEQATHWGWARLMDQHQVGMLALPGGAATFFARPPDARVALCAPRGRLRLVAPRARA